MRKVALKQSCSVPILGTSETEREKGGEGRVASKRSAEAMWLRAPSFHMAGCPSEWSNLWATFRTPSGDNGCTFEGASLDLLWGLLCTSIAMLGARLPGKPGSLSWFLHMTLAQVFFNGWLAPMFMSHHLALQAAPIWSHYCPSQKSILRMSHCSVLNTINAPSPPLPSTKK